MTSPTVCAVMLTRDRPEMAARAVEAFRAQTYPEKILLIFDTGRHHAGTLGLDFTERHDWEPELKLSMGALRNEVNDRVRAAEIIVHWDDDDYSHPKRIAEQVALLQDVGSDAVGYREMLFWREPAA